MRTCANAPSVQRMTMWHGKTIWTKGILSRPTTYSGNLSCLAVCVQGISLLHMSTAREERQLTCDVLGNHGGGHQVIVVRQAHQRMRRHVLGPQHQLVPLELPAEGLQAHLHRSTAGLHHSLPWHICFHLP